MRRRVPGRFAPLIVAIGLLVAGCGDEAGPTEEAEPSASSTTPTTASTSTTTTAPEPDPTELIESSFTLKVLRATGENRFAAYIYECDECTFEQHAALEPPDGFTKGPQQVIIPVGELTSAPAYDGVPASIDLIDEIPGDEFHLIGKNRIAIPVELGPDALIVRAQVERNTVFTYPAGVRVHELTSPEGDVFVLFAYQVDAADFDEPDLQSEAALEGHPFPEGWAYTTRVLDEDLHMDPEGLADVLAIQADVQSTWERR